MDPAYFLRHGAGNLLRIASSASFAANDLLNEYLPTIQRWIVFFSSSFFFFTSSSWLEKHNTRHLSFGTGRQEAVMRCDITKSGSTPFTASQKRLLV